MPVYYYILTGLIAELRVTKTMLVVCTAEYSCCALNEEKTYTTRTGIQQIEYITLTVTTSRADFLV